ncbi:MAG: capsular polysaccharide synthesis protein [Oscillospiraceae bacterium]|nr:capsular polysaccharide synthesis protein [Oscillospiraceae bacterium]
MKDFAKLFKKVGGKEILRQYSQTHVLLFAMIETLCMGFSKKGLELVREAVAYKQLNWLRRKYHIQIEKYCQAHTDDHVVHQISNKVWICWLQGMEQAPSLVRRCYQSVCENLPPEREIVVLTEQNYRDYVTFPDYIQQKINNGVITKTHFSDLLRLALLNRYGGTWIDATVFLSSSEIPSYMLHSELFMFQILKPGLDGHSIVTSSWFMTAHSSHPILLLTQHLLYEYWKNHQNLIDYFLLHDFMQLAIETFPKEWNKVVPFSNSLPHILLLRLFEPYDKHIWEAVKHMTPVHKLTYKYSKEDIQKKNTYYTELFC